MQPALSPKLFVLTLLTAGVLASASCNGKAATTNQGPPAPPVVVAQAVKRTVPVSLHGIGNVESLSSVAIKSLVTGQILKVHIADGADVVKGQPLFTIDPEPYRIAAARAEAQLARDTALARKAADDAARFESLVDQGIVTRSEYDNAVAQAAAMAAAVKGDEAAARDAKLSESYCTIKAPISGRVGSVSLKAGNLVKVNDDPPLVTLLQVRPVYVSFSVPEKYLPEVRAHAASGKLRVHAKARGETGDGHDGTLAFIDNSVDTTTGAIRLKAEFANDDRGLWPGQFVDAELVLAEQSDAVLVPTTAIQVGQAGSYVYIVKDDSTAELRPVTVDRAIGGETVISEGLSGGETVITDGQIRVVPGAKVAPAAAGA
jgi:multidrug efflux system membrane fusion protein